MSIKKAMDGTVPRKVSQWKGKLYRTGNACGLVRGGTKKTESSGSMVHV
jgi:hypothetical protein